MILDGGLTVKDSIRVPPDWFTVNKGSFWEVLECSVARRIVSVPSKKGALRRVVPMSGMPDPRQRSMRPSLANVQQESGLRRTRQKNHRAPKVQGLDTG